MSDQCGMWESLFLVYGCYSRRVGSPINVVVYTRPLWRDLFALNWQSRSMVCSSAVAMHVRLSSMLCRTIVDKLLEVLVSIRTVDGAAACHTAQQVYWHCSAGTTCFHWLIIPRHWRCNFGSRTFSVVGPSAWNSLADHLQHPTCSMDTLKTLLNNVSVCDMLIHIADLRLLHGARYKLTAWT